MKRITKECMICKEPQIISNTLNSKAPNSDIHLSIYDPSVDEREQVQDAIFLLDGDAFFNYTTARAHK
jgi:predicted alpha/beta superfamily hydrolase